MDTDDLIERLARDTRPVSAAIGPARIAAGLIGGGAVAMALLTATLGEPFHAVATTGVATFGVKLGFTVATLLIAATLLYDAARPGHRHASPLWLLAPAGVVAFLAAMALLPAKPELREHLLFGDTWSSCLAMVFLLALPIHAALAWALRSLAPTDLARAGTLAGIAAGAMSALVYALHCPETSPAFLLVWYGLAMCGAGLVGRITGPYLLRW